MSPQHVNETKNVAFNLIHVPDDENSRTSLDGIDELAENIKEHGLLQGLIVSNGGTGDKPYRLVAGFRRAAALKSLKWGDKTVPVTVVAPQGRAIKNLVENIHRNELPVADLASRLYELSTGDYPRDKGEERIEYTKEQLAAQLGLSVSHITNLIRAHVNLAPDVKKTWQQKGLPQNLVFKCAGLTKVEEVEVQVKDERGKPVKDEEGNIKTKTLRTKVPDEKAQEKALSKWEKAKEAEELAAKGKKKVAAEPVEGDENGDEPVTSDAKRPGKKLLAEFIEKASEKLKTYAAGSVEHAALKGKLEAVKWAAGEREALAPR